MNNENRVPLMKKIISLMVFACASLSFVVEASELRVRVFERGGNIPLPGVSVCLGTSARLDQFGSSRTDGNGYVLFTEVPRTRIVVTASMNGYKSEQESLVTSNASRMLVLSLSGGGGGTDCAVGDKVGAQASVELKVMRFTVNKGEKQTGNRTVSLDNSVSGMATQYRASERRDMEGAEWQYYATAPEFTLSEGPGLKRIYLQVRRHSTVNGATLETLSPVVQDTIRLR